MTDKYFFLKFHGDTTVCGDVSVSADVDPISSSENKRSKRTWSVMNAVCLTAGGVVVASSGLLLVLISVVADKKVQRAHREVLERRNM
mmetsp:Transcript_10472/g.13106  ORF Transcript_10472/g.13106 Transcript_10472/m.13106 type:complete len:88 (+) Transcript_10472:868-1131(+)